MLIPPVASPASDAVDTPNASVAPSITVEYALVALVVAVGLVGFWRLRGGRAAVATAPWTDFRAPLVPGWVAIPRGDSGPALGLQVAYHAPDVGVVASFYIYDHDEKDVRRDDAILLRELARVATGLATAISAGIWDATREVSAPMDAAFGGARWFRQRFAVTKEGRESFSEAWVTTHKGFYVKVRATYGGGLTEAAVTRVGVLIEAIGAATKA